MIHSLESLEYYINIIRNIIEYYINSYGVHACRAMQTRFIQRFNFCDAVICHCDTENKL
jgi:hypothetical protein